MLVSEPGINQPSSQLLAGSLNKYPWLDARTPAERLWAMLLNDGFCMVCELLGALIRIRAPLWLQCIVDKKLCFALAAPRDGAEQGNRNKGKAGAKCKR